MSSMYNPDLTRINRPKRQIIGPAQQFVNDEMGSEEMGPPSASQRFINSSTNENGPSMDYVNEQRSPVDVSTGPDGGESETQTLARDDSSEAPKAAKNYIQSYMADPEWQKAHADEDDIAEKLAPGIGSMILDRLTRGAYGQARARQLDAARYKKREVERRYLAIRDDERMAVDDVQRENAGIANNVNAHQRFIKDKEELEENRATRGYVLSEAEKKVQEADARIGLLTAQTEKTRASMAADKIFNIPANTDAYSYDQSTNKATKVASGPPPVFSPNGTARQDPSIPSASTVQRGEESRMQAILTVVTQLQDAQARGDGRLAGLSHSDLVKKATEEVDGIGGNSTPQAAPQYADMGSTLAAWLGMWNAGGSGWGGFTPTPSATPEPKRVPLRIVNGTAVPR